jgi:hypothetical protein
MDCSSVQLHIPRSQVPSLQSEIFFVVFLFIVKTIQIGLAGITLDKK